MGARVWRAKVVLSATVFTAVGAQERIGEIELSALDGSNGTMLLGTGMDGLAGFSVAGVGDLNGDGLRDVAVGAPLAFVPGRGNVGRVYVVFGAESYPEQLELSSLDGSAGFLVDGAQGTAGTGSSVALAGDVDGDGLDDLLVGSPGIESLATGHAYLVRGALGGIGPVVDLDELDGLNGTDLYLFRERTGASVAGAGDLNGDGLADIVLGSPSNGLEPDGKAFVVFGREGGPGPLVDLSGLNGDNGFVVVGSSRTRLGTSVSGAGDVDGDGLDDIVLGAPNEEYGGGNAFLIYGSSEGYAAYNTSVDLNGQNGFVVRESEFRSRAGRGVSGGDWDGDGLSDLIIGAPEANPNLSPEKGLVDVVFGGPRTDVVNVDPSELLSGEVATVHGSQAEGGFGMSVTGGCDVDGDDVADLVVGAYRDGYGYGDEIPGTGEFPGVVYVLYGSDEPLPRDMDARTPQVTTGFALTGIELSEQLGASVSCAGDLDGDGYSELIMGAPYASFEGREQAGRAYVVFPRRLAQSDLVVDAETNLDPVLVGEFLEYTLTVTNNGPVVATSVQFVVTLPAGLAAVSIHSSQGKRGRRREDEIVLTVGRLGVGDRAVATLVVQPMDSGEFATTVLVEGGELDLHLDDNAVTINTTAVGTADLQIELADSSDPVGVGESFTITSTTTNLGPSSANQIRVTHELPEGITADSVSTSQGECTQTNHLVECDIPRLEPEKTVTTTLFVMSSASGLLETTAVVSSFDSDPDLDNDTATEGTTALSSCSIDFVGPTLSKCPEPNVQMLVFGVNGTYMEGELVVETIASPAQVTVGRYIIPPGDYDLAPSLKLTGGLPEECPSVMSIAAELACPDGGVLVSTVQVELIEPIPPLAELDSRDPSKGASSGRRRSKFAAGPMCDISLEATTLATCPGPNVQLRLTGDNGSGAVASVELRMTAPVPVVLLGAAVAPGQYELRPNLQASEAEPSCDVGSISFLAMIDGPEDCQATAMVDTVLTSTDNDPRP